MRAHRPAVLVAALCLSFATACGDEARDVDDDSGTSSGSSGSNVSSGAGGATGSSTGTGATTGNPEPGQLAGITAAHNAARQAVDTPDPIPDLTWSPEIAQVAQAYADQLAANGCGLVHSDSPYGENLFAGTGTYTPADAMRGWVDEEIGCFTYTTFPEACSCTCGHYTQVVWRNTTQLGCGIGACPGGGEVWVCNYDPPGNYLTQMPY